MPNYVISFKTNVADIQRVRQQLRQVALDANRAGTTGAQSFRRMGAAATTAGRQAQVSFGLAGRAVNDMRASLNGVLSVFAAFSAVRTATTIVAEFEQTMAAVRAVTDATDKQFKTMNRTVRDLAKNTKFSATEAAGGMRFLAMAGFEAQEVIDALPATLRLAQIGMLDMARAGDIVTNVMAGFGIETGGLAHAVDVLAVAATSANTSVEQLGTAFSYAGPIAKSFGLTLEETNAAVGQLSNAGIQGERAGTALRRILLKLNEAGYDLQLGLLPVLKELRDSGKGIDELAKIVGVRFAGALNILVQNTKGVQELEDKLNNADGASERMAKTMEEQLKHALDITKSAFVELTLGIADFIDLEGGLRKLAAAVVWLSENLNILTDVFRTMLALFVTKTLTKAFYAMSISMASLTTAAIALRTALAALSKVFLLAAPAALLVFASALEESANPAVSRMGSELQVLKEILTEFFVDAAKILTTAENIETLGDAFAAFGQIVTSVFGGVLNTLYKIGVSLDATLQSIPGLSLAGYGSGLPRFSPGTRATAEGLLDRTRGADGQTSEKRLMDMLRAKIANPDEIHITYGKKGMFGGAKTLDADEAETLLGYFATGGLESIGPGGVGAAFRWADNRFSATGEDFTSRVDERIRGRRLDRAGKAAFKQAQANIEADRLHEQEQEALDERLQQQFARSRAYVKRKENPYAFGPVSDDDMFELLAGDRFAHHKAFSPQAQRRRAGLTVNPFQQRGGLTAEQLLLGDEFAIGSLFDGTNVTGNRRRAGLTTNPYARRFGAVTPTPTMQDPDPAISAATERAKAVQAMAERLLKTEKERKEVQRKHKDAFKEFMELNKQSLDLSRMTKAQAEEEEEILRLINTAKERGQTLTASQVEQARELLQTMRHTAQVQEQVSESVGLVTDAISDAFSKWRDKEKQGWDTFFTDLSNSFEKNFIEKVMSGIDRMAEHLTNQILNATEGKNSDFGFSGFLESFFNTSASAYTGPLDDHLADKLGAGVPGAANGGMFMVGGRAGTDRNTLDINGMPQLRVSRGESVHVLPRNAGGGVGNNVQISMPVTINEAKNPAATQSQLDRIVRTLEARLTQKFNNNRRLTGSAF